MGARRTTAVRSLPPAGDLAPAALPEARPVVARPRVDTFLDAVPQYAATVVAAPAGSGKSAAVAAWAVRAAGTGADVTWFRPDRCDLLVAALAAAPRAATPPVIVVDDAHLLPGEGSAAVTAALEEAPESVRLVLVTRHDLAWVPVSRQLDGRARRLPADDLRFRDDEAEALVRLHHPHAEDAAVGPLLREGAGWAVALVLGSRALHAAGHAADVRAALATARPPLLDYLRDEVLEPLPADLVRVLLTTCQHDHVTDEEAVLLSGLADAGELLGRAAAAGLFVTGCRDEADGSPGWHYHPLLADLLRRRTSPTGPDWPLVVEAHHRTTAVYADRRDAERAVAHARLSGDLPLLVRVLQEFAAELVLRRRTDVLAEALAAIPVEVRTRHHDLLVLQATVLRAEGRTEAARVVADRALADGPRALGAGTGRDVEADLAALDVWQARLGWRPVGPALARARRVLGCRHRAASGAHDLTGLSPVRAHWLMLELGSLETWVGDLDLAATHVQGAAVFSARAGLPVLEHAVLAHRAMLELVWGAYRSSLATAEDALLAGLPGLPGVADARAHLARGWARLHQLDVAGAQESLEELAQVPRELRDPLLTVYERLLQAGVLTETGHPEEARRLLGGHGDVPVQLPAHVARDDLLVRLLATTAMGDLAALERTTARMRRVDPTAADLGEAVLLGLRGEEQRAVRSLEGLRPTTADTPVSVGLPAAVARAAFLQRIGSTAALDQAHRLMPEVLSRAAPQRLLWILSLGCLISPGFPDLVGARATGPDAHPFATDAHAVLQAHARPYPDLTPHREAGPSGTSDETAPGTALTPREREVLEQLALGGGNADLARSLFVSENTVKTHLASIYRKLEVERRVDALKVARARGLV